MNVIVKSPGNCSESELIQYENLVLAGGEVQAHGLRKRLLRANKLVFVLENEVCVGTGAIKNPSENYKRSVFEKAEMSLRVENFTHEVGWLYASPLVRGKGIGNILMQEICNQSGDYRLFATTREDNKPMHHLFEKYGFIKLGKAYKSERGDHLLGLFVQKS